MRDERQRPEDGEIGVGSTNEDTVNPGRVGRAGFFVTPKVGVGGLMDLPEAKESENFLPLFFFGLGQQISGALTRGINSVGDKVEVPAKGMVMVDGIVLQPPELLEDFPPVTRGRDVNVSEGERVSALGWLEVEGLDFPLYKNLMLQKVVLIYGLVNHNRGPRLASFEAVGEDMVVGETIF